ncbi:MAG: FHIPEP family type III secretion protein, partial [Bordetella sp.]|nr:FHIPEP family type III secretion protein [Bordetella sp.]
IEVHLGAHWARVINEPGSVVMDRIASFRKQLAQELGVVLPRVRFRDMARLAPERYEIHLDGALAGKGEARPDRLLAIHPAGDTKSIPGEITRDPTYGLPALWIEEEQREAATRAQFTLVDAATVLMTHLTELLRRECSTLLSRAEVDRILSRVRKTHPGLVEELVPAVLSSTEIQRVLQGLLREKVSIRHIEAILETLADAGRVTRDTASLIEACRQRLGTAICQSLVGDAGALQVITLDPVLESQFMESVQAAAAAGAGSPLVIEPRLAERLVGRLIQQSERMMKSNLLPVLLCAPELRRHVRGLSERLVPHLRVVSMSEVPHNVELKSFGVVQAQP